MSSTSTDLFGVAAADAVVPEPSSLVLLGIGSLTVLGCAWHRRKRTAA